MNILHVPLASPLTDVDTLIALFEQIFYQHYNTRLVHSQQEPEYLPADDDCDFHRIAFAHGYFASALHEIAHWCIAGAARRLLPDFGYWYAPDGRNQQQQQAFYHVEVKPQALEWVFSVAAGRKFYISADNLCGDRSGETAFAQAVHQQVHGYLVQGLPIRAQLWAQALAQQFGTGTRYKQPQSYPDFEY